MLHLRVGNKNPKLIPFPKKNHELIIRLIIDDPASHFRHVPQPRGQRRMRRHRGTTGIRN